MLLFDIKTKEGEEYEKKQEEENNTANYDDEKEDSGVIYCSPFSGRACPPSALSGRACPPSALSGRACPPSALSGRACPPSALSGPACPPSALSPLPLRKILQNPLCRLGGLRLFILLLGRNSVQESSIFVKLSTNVLCFILLPGLFVSSKPQEKKTGDVEDVIFETNDDGENLMESLVLMEDLENNPFTLLELLQPLSPSKRDQTVKIVVPVLNPIFISSPTEESFGLIDRHLRSLRPYTDSILATQSTQLKKTPYLGTYNSDPFLLLDQTPPIP
ncbi:hypothetical protein BLNAU_3787 [Blattamonas nauphoetae]|uniref:Uncharacterized protein n=1 Tax=Blattamonas nauphoetae TaxID=2049346 RepID=A0ABQ9YCE4_9EUKA|nr:hypothetical protein BLNAU_3787 [Blattamonas nauphoetae]